MSKENGCCCGHHRAEHFFDRVCLMCLREPRPYQRLPDGTWGQPLVHCARFSPQEETSKPTQ